MPTARKLSTARTLCKKTLTPYLSTKVLLLYSSAVRVSRNQIKKIGSMKFGGANANNLQLGYNFSRRKATNFQVIVYSLVAFIVSRLHTT